MTMPQNVVFLRTPTQNLLRVGDSPACQGACCPPSLPAYRDAAWRRSRRLALSLSVFSVVWMSGEGALGLISGVRADSVSLLGWALGSVIEGLASVIVIWRFTGARTLSETAERRAQRAVGFSFYLLAPYIAALAVDSLIRGHTERTTVLGVAVTASSLLVMPALGAAKQRLGRRLESSATAGEGNQNLLCAAQAAAVLIGLATVAATGWSWPDAAIAVFLAGWAVREGRNTWRGEACC